MASSRRQFLNTAAAAVAVSAAPSGRALAGAPGPPGMSGTPGGWKLPDAAPFDMIENVFIPMEDGVRLAVQLWLPQGADHHPVPVVLEYIPYRKRDRYRAYDLFWGAELAGRGVAYARLDARGSGDSGGVLVDEYLPREHQDAVEAIAWLAGRPWCNGSVGMRGVSWGGFSTLQTAAYAPPALKAIMPMSASDIRYTDDAHYIGGALGLTDLKWAASFKVVMASPPDPEISGPDWERMWRERLDATPPIAATWLSHQRNDAYWRQGSIAYDYGAIKCPVYVVGGLVDAYSNEIPRLLEGLKTPTKALFGPWQHGYPQPAKPGPGLQWAYEEVRWWKQWLAGEETGIRDEPRVRVFMPDRTASEVAPGPIPGRWVAEASWPSASVAPSTLYLAGSGRLQHGVGSGGTIRYVGDKVVGLGRPEWVPFAPSELPHEQGPDDALSQVFDSTPLEAPLEMLGRAVVRLRVRADRPVAKLALRLTELTPEGRSWMVTYGVLNLTHRDSHSDPTPLEPGRFYDVAVPLNFIAHRFRRNSRIRLALSESLWPLVWPSPQVVTLDVDLGASSLDLPIRTPPAVEASFPIPIVAGGKATFGDTDPVFKVERRDGVVRLDETWAASTETLADIGTTLSGSGPNVSLQMREGDPDSCVWTAVQTAGYRRGAWNCTVDSFVSLTATPTTFRVIERTTARNGSKEVFNREQVHQISRDLM